jgi:Flp pilus assembly protein TadD
LELTDRVQRLSNFALQAADDNDWSQAIGQMQQAIDLCKDCAQVGILRKNLGIIYARRGDVGDAKQQLELALKLLPEGPDSVATSETLKRLTPDAQTPTPSP